MSLPESERHTFIVRFWRQPREIEGQPPDWRGSIESAAGGKRRYFLTFQEMILFMVEAMQLGEADLRALMRSEAHDADSEAETQPDR